MPAGGRMAALARLVPRGSVVAEIGAGGGRISARLVATGRATRAIATELNDRSAAELLPAASDRVDVRVGDGLSALTVDDSVDVLLLAGLGARAIIRILDDPGLREIAPQRLVLQPQTEIPLVRRWLTRRSWKIIGETLCRDRGRFYTVIAAQRCETAGLAAAHGLTRDELFEVGPLLVRAADPLVDRFWRKELERNERLLRGAKGPGHRRVAARIELARRVLRARR